MEELPRIVTSENEVQVFSSGNLRWRLTIADLVFVGEYTEGPADDYFLEFVSVKNGLWSLSWVTFYSDGGNEAIAALGRKLGQPLAFELCNSTRFKSRAMWPPELAGKPYRTLVPYKSRWDAFVRSLTFRGRDHTFSHELISYVGSKCKSTSTNYGS